MDAAIEGKEEAAESEHITGFGWFNIRPKVLKVFDSTKWLFLLLCCYFLVNSTVVNGLYSTTISTIEKRFLLSSSRMGVVTSIYDVGALLTTGPVSYFGVRNKPVTLGVGMITMGIGYLIFMSPHFIANEYIPVVGSSLVVSNYSSPLVCAASSSRAALTACRSTTEGSDLFYVLFLLAFFIAGAGCSPMLTIGIPYLDESVSKENSPIYIGLFQTSGIAAAVVGFLLSSVFLSIFVHPSASVRITKKSPSWIGAWWLGFALGAIFAVIVGILLTGLPKRFRDRHKDEKKENPDLKINKKEEKRQEYPGAKEIFSVLNELIIKNKVFVFVSAAVSVQIFLVSGGTAFNAKIALFQYRMTASEVSIYYGLSSGTGAVIGNIAGSIILKKFRLSSIGVLKFAVVMSLITTVLCLNAFFYCDTYPVPGVNTNFPNTNTSGIALHSGCNRGCSCMENMFLPICNEGMTYVNPCNAGCKKMVGAGVFSNCSCVPSNDRKTALGTIGLCKTSCGVTPILYYITAWFVGFAVMCNATPCTMATLRCVPNKLQSFALGLQWMLVRVLGAIPGPIIFGYMIDQSCVFWSKKECSSFQGTCTIYDNKKLAMTTGALALGLNILTTVFLVLAYFAEKSRLAVTETGGLAISSGGNMEKEMTDINAKL